MKVRRYEDADAPAIARLNGRLRAGNVPHVVYTEGAEQHRPGAIRERMFVAEHDGEIHGAVWLREQTFRIRGQDVRCGWLKYPVAESLIDPKFNGVAASLIMHCMREQPRLFALGLGGHETPLARMLKALRWTGVTVPMLARLVRPGRVLRQAPAIRQTPFRRAAANLLGWSGLASLGLWLRDVVSGARAARRQTSYSAVECASFGPWADALWQRVRDRYGFLAARDSVTVEALMPRSSDITRLRVRDGDEDVGWVTIVRHDFSIGAPDRHLGALRVGVVADALAAPEHVRGTLAAALRTLELAGMDMIFTNQLHAVWTEPLRDFGLMNVPSNFALYASPIAAALASDWHEAHVNRGDCDGPIWYDGA